MRFPLNAAVRSNEHDQPKPAKIENTIGVFDNYGYRASFGQGSIELPGDMLDVGLQIAALANEAYEQGKEDARREMREALGIEK